MKMVISSPHRLFTYLRAFPFPPDVRTWKEFPGASGKNCLREYCQKVMRLDRVIYNACKKRQLDQLFFQGAHGTFPAILPLQP